jgi:hypothetical protein
MASILRRSHALGVAEMMNFPAVIAGEDAELAKLRSARRRTWTGTRPGVTGRELDAYLAAGIASDHEATTVAEALEKRRKGAWVLIREASNARNLVDLLPLVRDFGRSTARSARTTASRTSSSARGRSTRCAAWRWRPGSRRGRAAAGHPAPGAVSRADRHGCRGARATAPTSSSCPTCDRSAPRRS